MTPIELIGQHRKPREPGEVTHARRFARRAREHGVHMQQPEWGEKHAIMRWGDRTIRINRDGHAVQSQKYADPHWRGTAARIYHYDIVIARRFRLYGLPEKARRALALAARSRAECPQIPA